MLERSRPPRGARRPTIAMIAQEAGVSVPTVSRVLNGRADVAPSTRVRVEAVISEHRYRRRGGPSGPPSPVIDVVFHELDGAWAVEVMRGVTRVAREEGLMVSLTESLTRTVPVQGWVDAVLARRPTGVILVVFDLSARQHAQLTSRGIPFAVLDPAGEPAESVPAIGSANWNGGMAVARHLLDLGHRRIGVIGGPPDLVCSRARLDGYRAAMDMAGIPIELELVRAGDFHVESGHDNGLALLRLPSPPTAVFAGSDLQALGVYEAARELGVRIPEELSVVGYDDLPVARWVGPPLTTIHQPLAEMAEMAARMVITMSRGAEPVTRRLDLATSLVVRHSTAPPRLG
jgi:LacI family xylobiose transport system transcriptional regulator